MLNYPRIKYNYYTHFPDPDKILFSSEKENVLLSGKPYHLVLSVLKSRPGGISTDELTSQLAEKLSAFEVYYILDILEKKGYLTESATALSENACAFWNNMGMDANQLVEALTNRPVSFRSLEPAFDEVFSLSFQSIGVRIKETGQFNVIVTGNYQHKELAQINREHLSSGQPWMLVKPAGVDWWLGPILIPGKTGCWECLNQRLSINNPINTFYKIQEKNQDNLPVPQGYVPPSLRMAADQAVLETVKWLYHGSNPTLEGKIVSFDSQSLQSAGHVLVKRPQCPACGVPLDSQRTPEPVVLHKTSQYCTSFAGGYREIPPEDTLENYQHHISPITGIVKALKPYYSIKGTPVYNYSSGPNTALRSKSLFWLNSYIRGTNGGKGKTPAQAKAGALCEAIERYCITFQGDEPRISSSQEKLNQSGQTAIHPNRCMNFSSAQYRDREALNRDCTKLFALVPLPFDSDETIEWTPVYSLTEKRFKLLPTAFCYNQYPTEDESAMFCYPDSNGCAAGNTLEEAILQGFLELVERDAVALWWYNRVRRPGLALESFDDPYIPRLIEYYQSLGRRLYVLDLSADLRIPAFAAVSFRPGSERRNIMFGFGAHVDAKIALERALVELNQLLPIAQAPGTDWKQGRYLTQDKVFTQWLNNATLENQPYFIPSEDQPAKTAADYPQLCDAHVQGALEYCLDRAGEAGLETLVLDATRPDIGLPAVRVFMPGMRHFWKRLAPGRLYDVPVKLGWRDTPLKEDEVNPIGLFI